jgi:hypothetical protein
MNVDCFSDKNQIKLYSSENNMNPGKLLAFLSFQISFFDCLFLFGFFYVYSLPPWQFHFGQDAHKLHHTCGRENVFQIHR